MSESLYVEPERRAPSEVDWPALELPRRLQDLPLGPGRDGRAARPRPAGRARRAGRGARPVRLRQEHAARARRRRSTSPRRARCARRRALAAAARRGRARRATARASVALVFQSDNLWPALSARENVAHRAAPGRVATTPSGAADEALAAFGLGERARPPRGRAVRRRAAARGDRRRGRAPRRRWCSPTSRPASSTPRNERIVLDALRAAARRATAARSSSSPTPSASPRAADRVIEMRDGRVVA